MKILIAEDDEISKKMLQTILIKEGHAISAAEDGAKALEAIQKASPTYSSPTG